MFLPLALAFSAYSPQPAPHLSLCPTLPNIPTPSQPLISSINPLYDQTLSAEYVSQSLARELPTPPLPPTFHQSAKPNNLPAPLQPPSVTYIYNPWSISPKRLLATPPQTKPRKEDHIHYTFQHLPPAYTMDKPFFVKITCYFHNIHTIFLPPHRNSYRYVGTPSLVAILSLCFLQHYS